MTTDILARNHVQQLGSGAQTIVFAHGFGCDQRMWRLVAPSFAEAYRVILFDYVGSGRSDMSAYDAERYGSLNGYVQDVLEICDALDLSDIIFVGHSISGLVGLLASLQAPELFARLILLGSSACYLNDPPTYRGGFDRADIDDLLDLMEKNYAGWASYLAPLVMANPGQPELTRELEATFHAHNPVVARRFAAVSFLADYRSELPSVAVPSLLLQCADDIIVPAEAAEYLHRQLQGSTFCQMSATGHYPHLSHADETIQLIREYLGSTLAA